MSEEENKRIVRRAIEDVFNAAHPAAVHDLYGPDFVKHTPPSMGPEVWGVDRIQPFAAAWRAAFPDLLFTVEAEWADADTVVTRWTARGTHRNALRGIPPTGKRVVVMALEVSRIADGKIVEQWLAWDTLGLLQQLGGVLALETALVGAHTEMDAAQYAGPRGRRQPAASDRDRAGG